MRTASNCESVYSRSSVEVKLITRIASENPFAVFSPNFIFFSLALGARENNYLIYKQTGNIVEINSTVTRTFCIIVKISLAFIEINYRQIYFLN